MVTGARRSGELTTTSFALLGLLAVRPAGWSAYELARQMSRSLQYVWPRAERNLYDEVKLLADRGLARTKEEPVGKRPRTVYSITSAGRRALRTWISEPSAPLTLESEALVRVFFGEQGEVDDLLAAIRAIRQEAENTELRVAEMLRLDDKDGGPFPSRLHVTALMGKLLFSHREAIRRWADWAEAEVSQWGGATLAAGARIPDGVFDEIVAAAKRIERNPREPRAERAGATRGSPIR
ncbi:MAG TPA: PadR family transcriptional regulator [Acidimicrobiales bacterium]|nr:PadR family transcriptional regulator [Acidimicrobiales bacterium]